MARSHSPSFITELPLVVDSKQEKELNARFQASRQLYNACLNEAMVRMDLMRVSPSYQEALKIPRTDKKTRSLAFNALRKIFGYSDYALQSYGTIVSNQSIWIAQKIDSNTQQKIATRAFKASERVLFGQAKKVRYKIPSRFRSVEGKSNKQGIRWKDNQVIWGNLKLKPLINENNPVILHGLNAPIKYVRILWRELNGKRRWFAQLIIEGLPYQKPQNYVSDGLVGLDLNVSNIAFVGNNCAGLLPFAQGVPTRQKEIGKLQRKMERSGRATNPDNYQVDTVGKRGRKTVVKKGKTKKGKRDWKQSKNYRRIAQRKRELERKKTAYAKSQNRRIVNEILRHGKDIKTENVSVRGWQKRYGKAIAAKSPSFVQSELKRKAESAGGSFLKFSTQKTALSQTHLSGERIKKSLSERVHYDATGKIMQRDLFSAYLSRYVNQDVLSLQDAFIEYQRLEPILLEAWEQFHQQTTNRVGKSESRLTDLSSESFSNKLGKVNQISHEELKVNSDS